MDAADWMVRDLGGHGVEIEFGVEAVLLRRSDNVRFKPRERREKVTYENKERNGDANVKVGSIRHRARRVR